MMENYSSNLEALVDERTTQLVEEKKKTDKLLYSLIPALVYLMLFFMENMSF